MRNTFILAVCLFLLFPASAIAQEPRHDGVWWNKIPGAAKPLFLSGVSDGILLSRELARLHLLEKLDSEQGLIRILDNTFDEVQVRYMADVSVEQLALELNRFYLNSRNKPILINDAIRIALAKIAGMPESAYHKLVEDYRRKAKEK